MSEETMENAIKQAKMERQNCKAMLTRLGETVRIQVSGNRPANEVKGGKHQEQTLLIDYDSVLRMKRHGWKNVKKPF